VDTTRREQGKRLLPLSFPWPAWAGILAIWTVALLSSRAPRLGAAVLPAGWLFFVSKGLHFLAYATLSGLVCWLKVRRRLQVAAWLGLLGHGALTELLQRFVEGRHGSLADVGLDACSVLVGLTAGLAWQRLIGFLCCAARLPDRGWRCVCTSEEIRSPDTFRAVEPARNAEAAHAPLRGRWQGGGVLANYMKQRDEPVLVVNDEDGRLLLRIERATEEGQRDG
jgi:hypothetical protein